MKLKKRFLLTCIILVLVASSLLAACGSNNGGSNSSNPGNTVSNGEKDAEDTQTPTEIRILAANNDTPYAIELKEDDRYVEKLSELSGYNLSYELLGHKDYNKQLTVRFASGQLADMIRTPSILSAIHPGAVEQGIFRELGPLIDQYGPNLKKHIPESVWKDPYVAKDGKIYGIPTFWALPASAVTYIRQDWLDKLDMEAPKSIDDFLAYFEAVKSGDMNGDGDPNNEYGLYVRENLSYSHFFFKSVGGVSPRNWTMVDGQLTPDMILPGMKDAIAFWKMLYDNGYINPNLFTNKSADWKAGIYKGLGGMWMHDVMNYTTTWDESKFMAAQPNHELSMIESPTGPKGQGITPVGTGIYYVWVVPSTVSDEKAIDIIKFLDWIYASEDAHKLFAYGIEGYNYTVDNGKVNWDLNNPANLEKDATAFYRVILDPRGDGRMRPLALDVMEAADKMKAGVEVALNNAFDHDGQYMPPLDSLQAHPELTLGNSPGTLFLDMFAKVITGQDELDPAFEQFVEEWKSRGGDEAINEATAWYNNFHKK